MPDYIRAYVQRATDGESDSGPIRFVASTENVARDGMIINADAWDLTNYSRNNIVLWSHDYFGTRPPIGRADVQLDKRQLIADVTFDDDDPFAAEISRKVRAGFLNAVSVGWNTLEVAPAAGDLPARVTKADLLDISVVPVPADPSALAERQKRGLADVGAELVKLIEPDGANSTVTMTGDPKEIADALRSRQHRGAIPPHTTDKAPEDQAWDGPGEVAKAEGKQQLRRMHAWVDDEGDEETKRAYKLPHHTAEGVAVWRGVAAAMSRLMQKGTKIPDGDRRGTHRHLSAHYQLWDKTPPEFRTNDEIDAYSPTEIRGLFLEGEAELFPDIFALSDQRAGAAINARNRERIERAITELQEVLTSTKKAAEDEERAAEIEALRVIAAAFDGHDDDDDE